MVLITMNVLFYSYSLRRRSALNGKINFAPLLVVMAVTFLVSYSASFLYSTYSLYKGANIAYLTRIIEFLSIHIPIIRWSSSISIAPKKLAFVMAIQWIISPVYASLLFGIYCPFTKTSRVAVKRWFELNPLVPGMALKAALLLVFFIATILGDLGIIHFPTFLNGNFISSDPTNFIIVKIINSDFLMPLFSWFVAFTYFFVYWMFLYIVANRKILFDQPKGN